MPQCGIEYRGECPNSFNFQHLPFQGSHFAMIEAADVESDFDEFGERFSCPSQGRAIQVGV
jgi:hypothetical protein